MVIHRRIYMKAAVINAYGELDTLSITELPDPTIKENEILVSVKATSVNFNNCMHIKGNVLVVRPFFGITRPKIKTPGNDIAGIIEAVGSAITKFKPGDEVFGDTSGKNFSAFAEKVVVRENDILCKPTNCSFEQAAAVPEASLVALQALRNSGKIQSSDKVLICGASGGIGSFAVQFAKDIGAHVTAVCSTRNVDFVSSLGADRIIDYIKEDFVDEGEQYNLIIATAGYRTLGDYKKALLPNGRYISTGGSMKQVFQSLLLGPLYSLFSSKKLGSMIVKVNQDLDYVRDRIEAGAVVPRIDTCYTFNAIVDALKQYDTGKAQGKIVVSVS